MAKAPSERGLASEARLGEYSVQDGVPRAGRGKPDGRDEGDERDGKAWDNRALWDFRENMEAFKYGCIASPFFREWVRRLR